MWPRVSMCDGPTMAWLGPAAGQSENETAHSYGNEPRGATGHAVGNLIPKHGSICNTKKVRNTKNTHTKEVGLTNARMTSCTTPPPLPRTRHCPLRGAAHFLPFAPGQARDWVESRWAHYKVRPPKTTLQRHSPGAEPRRLQEPDQPQGRCPLSTGDQPPSSPRCGRPPSSPGDPLSSPGPSEAVACPYHGPHAMEGGGGWLGGARRLPGGCGSGSLSWHVLSLGRLWIPLLLVHTKKKINAERRKGDPRN